MPKSKTPRSTPKKLVARTTASGAQQYVRGKDVYDRVKTAGEAVRSTKNIGAKQMLMRAQTEAMSPGARARYNQMLESEKRAALARGRKRSGK